MHRNGRMKAGELCIREVATATARETVVAAARRMADLRTGDLIVVEHRSGELPRPLGVVTDRDLVVRVLACAERSPTNTTIGDVMRPGLVTASEDEDVERILARMRDHAIRRIPIVDRRGGLRGILSLDDVLCWMREQIEVASKMLERHEGLQLDAPLR
jgi:CBS domain-containing protein